MRVFTSLAICLLLLAGVAAAADIDGKWISERKFERDGQSMVIVQTFDLKADGAKLNGKFSMKFGDNEMPPTEIKNGKIEAGKFSFSVTMSTPNGDFTTVYSGTLEGDMIKGNAEREGGGQPRPFDAKRAK